MLAVITPWRNHPELLADYQFVMGGVDQIVIVLNDTSDPTTIETIGQWAAGDNRVRVVHVGKPIGFSEANNLGVEHLDPMADLVYFVNNDVHGSPTWADIARSAATGTDAICGAEMSMQPIGSHVVPFLSGWCIGAKRGVWDRIGWWRVLPAPYYWEDVELCLRARVNHISMNVPTSSWGIHHKGNATVRDHPGLFHIGSMNEEFIFDHYGDILEQGW